MFKKFFAALVVGATLLTACDNQGLNTMKDPAKETKTLANGIQIPLLGFGTWKLIGTDGYLAVRSAIENGYRLIDTAYVYENETAVGMAVRDSSVARQNLFITSKVPHYVKTYDGTIEMFEKSLADLGTDYLDLYLIHWPVTQPLMESGDKYYAANREVWRAMEDLYNSGRVRAIGVSNFSIADINNLLAVATVRPMVNQIKYHIGHHPDDILKFCKKHNIIVEGYSTLGRGAVLQSPEVQRIANKYKVSPAQIAIRYSLQKGVIPLVKSGSQSHQIENLNVGFEISRADMQTLDELEINSKNW